MILIGILILIIAWPTGGSKKNSENSKQSDLMDTDSDMINADEINTAVMNRDNYAQELESQLTELIASIERAGKSKVMITLEGSEETVVLKEQNYTRNNTVEADAAGGSRTVNEMEQNQQTVSVLDKEGNTTPFILFSKNPKVEGVVVICEGAGKSNVSAQIVKAVQALFGTPEHKVVVIKMKSEQ